MAKHLAKLHPCNNCKAYDEPSRQQGRVNCPILGRQISLEGCNKLAGAHTKVAIQLLEEHKADRKGGEVDV